MMFAYDVLGFVHFMMLTYVTADASNIIHIRPFSNLKFPYIHRQFDVIIL